VDINLATVTSRFRFGVALAAAMIAHAAIAQDQNVPAGPLPVKPAPVPTGVIPLPSGPPQTSQQAPVPTPILPLRDPLHPLAWSPDLAGIKQFVSKQPITLQQAVAISLYTDRAFANAVANLELSEGRTGEARAQLQPNLGVSGQITEFDAPTTFNIGALVPSSGGTSTPPFTIVPQFNPIFTAAFTLPIDVFGTLRSAASQAQFEEVAARIDVNRVRNQIVYDVKTAFYNVLRAQAQVLVSTNNLNNALFRLSDANKNYSAGTASRYDVITAQRDVADAQQGLITAKAQVTVNLAALKNTMGLSLEARLNISDAGAIDYPQGVLPPTVAPVGADGEPLLAASSKVATPQPATVQAPEPVEPAISVLPQPNVNVVEDDFDWGPEFQQLLTEATQNRPEILEAAAQITANQKGVQFAKRSILPSFNLSLEDQYTPDAAGFTRVNEGIFTLGFNIPVYDGGLARERVKQQKASIAQSEINRRQAADQVQVDVQQAYITLVQARQRVAVANVEVSQARESFRVSRVRYRAGVSQQTGVSPQLELSNSQIGLAQAESNQVNALYDYNNARAQLDRAVGRYAFTGLGPGYGTAPGSPVTGQSPAPTKTIKP
jgi:outer membrane protein